MQRLVSLKLASKFLRNGPNSTPSLQSFCSNAQLSLFKTDPNRHFAAADQPACFFTLFRAARHSWMSQNGFSEKLRGFLSDPVLANQLVTNAIRSKGLLDSKVGFLRTQFPRGNFGLNSSLDARHRTWRSWLRRQMPDRVVLGLIVTNTAIFMLWRLADQQFMLENFTISVNNFKSGRLYTLITSAFSHIDVGHLVSNMIGLYFFGMHIGQAFGAEFLLKLYLSGAIVGSIFYLVHHAFMTSSSKSGRNQFINPSSTSALGASGAVNAIMLLDIFLFPKSTLYLDFFMPVPAILLGIFLIGKDMLTIIEGDSQISGSAHLGGAVVAAVAWARFGKGRF